MRHARTEALDELEPLLQRLRAMPHLREKSRGTFYRGSRAFLHFHEDPAGLFADVRFAADFERCEVTSDAQRDALVRAVAAVLSQE